MNYYGTRTSYTLMSNPLKSGGEGAVYEVSGYPDIVAKIYHPEKLKSDCELNKKITYMVANPPDKSVLNQVAWPIDVLYDGNLSFAGFIMPKLKTDTDLKSIYPYPPEKLLISYENKLIIAVNICVVISEIHKAGYTFGDFNPMNIGVNLQNGHIAFFDTDSFHFTDHSSNHTYRCGVACQGYVAPELLHKCRENNDDYLSAPLPTFTEETDNFALAIHIFKLLMNGYTPFNGINETESSSTSSPGTGNTAIERNNYCFNPGKKPQSPAVLDLSCFTPSIQFLFQKTFIDGYLQPQKRASAADWIEALKGYRGEMTQCKANPLHFYYANNSCCPYCEADERYRQNLAKSASAYTTGTSGSANQISFSSPVSVPTQLNSGSSANYQASPHNNASPRPTTAAKPQRRKKSRKGLVTLFVLAGLAIAVWKLVLPQVGTQSSNKRSSTTTAAAATAVTEEIAELGSKTIELHELTPIDEQCLTLESDNGYVYDSVNWDGSFMYRAGNGERNAFAIYDIGGKFGQISLRATPYDYSDSSAIDIMIINAENGGIISSTPLDQTSKDVKIECDITGINKLGIYVIKNGGMFAYTLIKDVYLTPASATTEVSPDSGKYDGGTELHELTTADEQSLTTEAKGCFICDNVLLDGSFVFRAGNGDADSFAVYEIDSQYKKLTLQAAPQVGNDGSFFESSTADIQIVNEVSGEILASTSINYNSGIVELEADISNVNRLGIHVTKTGGMLAYTFVRNAYLFS